MSDEFSIDIDKALENAKNTDHIGFDNPRPDGLESVKQAVTNCIDLAGLDKKLMSNIVFDRKNFFFFLQARPVLLQEKRVSP